MGALIKGLIAALVPLLILAVKMLQSQQESDESFSHNTAGCVTENCPYSHNESATVKPIVSVISFDLKSAKTPTLKFSHFSKDDEGNYPESAVPESLIAKKNISGKIYQCVDLIKRYANKLGYAESTLGDGHATAQGFAEASDGQFTYISGTSRDGVLGKITDDQLPKDGSVLSIQRRPFVKMHTLNETTKKYVLDEKYGTIPLEIAKDTLGHVGIVVDADFVEGSNKEIYKLKLFDQNSYGAEWKTVIFTKNADGDWVGKLNNSTAKLKYELVSGWANPISI